MDVFKLIQVSVVRGLAATVGSAPILAAPLLFGAPIPAASADPCPDVEVVFARGSGEPPGLGSVGVPLEQVFQHDAGPSSPVKPTKV